MIDSDGSNAAAEEWRRSGVEDGQQGEGKRLKRGNGGGGGGGGERESPQ